MKAVEYKSAFRSLGVVAKLAVLPIGGGEVCFQVHDGRGSFEGTTISSKDVKRLRKQLKRILKEAGK